LEGLDQSSASATAALSAVAERARAMADGGEQDDAFNALGDLLFDAVAAARELKVDPELALRQATIRFQRRVEATAD
jgi:uncharacterized protein YabN with tetrapyrrole methylase and pyrophosphatase domain